MCDCDGEPPSAYWESNPKAIRRHKCSECRGWIEPGEVYWKVSGIWEGERATYKTCSDCQGLLKWAKERSDCLCFSFGNLHTSILDDAHESGIAVYETEAKFRITEVRKKRREPVAA